MSCGLEDHKTCELKTMFINMAERQESFELRQKSFEDRQAKNEISIANTERNIVLLQKDMSESNLELRALGGRVDVNTEQLLEIKNDIKPITDGVNEIGIALKPWIWVVRKIKWIATTILAGWVLFMDGLEHFLDFIGKGHH